MKNSKLPAIALMALVVLLLGVNSLASAQTVVAQVDETKVFDYGENEFLSSKDGDVDNFYTSAIITQKGNKIVFKMNTKQGEQLISEYKVVNRAKNGKLITCKKTTDGSQILIKQKKHSFTVNLDYVESADKYDAAIVFTDFQGVDIGYN